MRLWIERSLLAAAAVGLLAACASDEERCRDGLEKVNSEYMFLHNVDNGRLKYDEDVVQGGMHVNSAQTQKATRNFEGCVESVREARRHLRQARERL